MRAARDEYAAIRKRYLSDLLAERLMDQTRVRVGGVSLEVRFDPGKGAVWASSLGADPYLPVETFVVASDLLSAQGPAPLGDAMKGALGDDALPMHSVEGAVAREVFGRRAGERVYRRITAIAAVMVHLRLAKLNSTTGLLESPGIDLLDAVESPIELLEVVHSSP